MSFKSFLLVLIMLNFLFAALNLLMFFLTDSTGSAIMFLVNLVMGGVAWGMRRNTSPEEKVL
jgi:hypothetical protein